MGVTTTKSHLVKVGNGSGTTVSRNYSMAGLTYFDSADVSVRIYNRRTSAYVDLQSGTDFTVSPAGITDAVMTTVARYAGTTRILIYNNQTIEQSFAFENCGTFYAGDHEEALDRLTIVTQQNQDYLDHSMKVRITDEHDTNTDTDVSNEMTIGIESGAAMCIDSDLLLYFAPGADAAGRTGVAAVAAASYASDAAQYALDASASVDSCAVHESDASSATTDVLATYAKIGLIVVNTTEAVTASAGHAYEVTPASGSSVTIDLDPSPTEGDQVVVKNTTNAWRAVVIDGNGNNVDGWSSIDLVYPQDAVTLVYNGSGVWHETHDYDSGYDTPNPYMVWASGSSVTVQAKPGYSSIVARTMQNDKRYWFMGTLTIDPTTTDTWGGVYDGPLAASGFGYVYMVPDPATARGYMNVVLSANPPSVGPGVSSETFCYIGSIPMSTSQSVEEFVQNGNEILYNKPENFRMILSANSSAWASNTWHVINSDMHASLLPATSSTLLCRMKVQFYTSDAITITLRDDSGTPSGGDPGSSWNIVPTYMDSASDRNAIDFSMGINYDTMYMRATYWEDAQSTTKKAASAVQIRLGSYGYFDDWVE